MENIMNLRKLFSIDPNNFIAELKTQHTDFLSLETATALDAEDI